MPTAGPPQSPETIDPVTLAVLVNRLDGVVREMTNTMVRTARSTTMASRDFSCSIISAKHELVAAPEGVPVHVFGSGLLGESMAELHPDLKEGDAFLHNDPYHGNTHAADHTLLVPVFFDGAHVFTTAAKAHQADIGNSIPTTYMPTAKDVYEEGALIFPCVRIQEHYEDVADIIRMCERRIRVPDVWYGDYLASLGACRLAERRLKALCSAYGLETVARVVKRWLDYSEEMAIEAISRLPAGRVTARTTLDPFPPGLPDGLPLKAEIEVDPEEATIAVDLRGNPDCTPTGLNLSRATAMNSAISGVLMVLNSDPKAERATVPNNSGAYRRLHVRLRENCVVGLPVHPASCSMATTTIAERVTGMVAAAFSQLGDGWGLAEPCWGTPPFAAVVSGYDPRRDREYILQLFSGTAGGPATANADGWLSFENNAGAGVSYIDSAEIEEQMYPFVIWANRVRPDSGGPGRYRGAPGNLCVFGPRWDSMMAYYSLDGSVHAPQGVAGGGQAQGPAAALIEPDGTEVPLPAIVGEQRVEPDQRLVSLSAGGGGYGDPLERPPDAVLDDVIRGYVTVAHARDAFGVVLTGDPKQVETVTIDIAATRALRGQSAMVQCGEDE